MTKLLFTNARLLDNRFAFVAVEGKRISYIGEERPEGEFDRVVDCRGNLLMNGFYNTHCHAAMTLFRGYGEDLPLREWLDTRILPAEDRLDDEKVYYGTLLAIAEMLASGKVEYAETNLNLETNTQVMAQWKYFDATQHKRRRSYIKKL